MWCRWLIIMMQRACIAIFYDILLDLCSFPIIIGAGVDVIADGLDHSSVVPSVGSNQMSTSRNVVGLTHTHTHVSRLFVWIGSRRWEFCFTSQAVNVWMRWCTWLAYNQSFHSFVVSTVFLINLLLELELQTLPSRDGQTKVCLFPHPPSVQICMMGF